MQVLTNLLRPVTDGEAAKQTKTGATEDSKDAFQDFFSASNTDVMTNDTSAQSLESTDQNSVEESAVDAPATPKLGLAEVDLIGIDVPKTRNLQNLSEDLAPHSDELNFAAIDSVAETDDLPVTATFAEKIRGSEQQNASLKTPHTIETLTLAEGQVAKNAPPLAHQTTGLAHDLSKSASLAQNAQDVQQPLSPVSVNLVPNDTEQVTRVDPVHANVPTSPLKTADVALQQMQPKTTPDEQVIPARTDAPSVAVVETASPAHNPTGANANSRSAVQDLGLPVAIAQRSRLDHKLSAEGLKLDKAVDAYASMKVRPEVETSALPQVLASQQQAVSAVMLTPEIVEEVEAQELLLLNRQLEASMQASGRLQPSPITVDLARNDALVSKVANALEVTIKRGTPGNYEIKLNPAELGSVRIMLSHGETGITAVISADRPEVLDLLRRHSELLSMDLKNGSDTNVDMSFKKQGDQDNKTSRATGSKVVLQSGHGEIDPITAPHYVEAGLDIRL